MLLLLEGRVYLRTRVVLFEASRIGQTCGGTKIEQGGR